MGGEGLAEQVVVAIGRDQDHRDDALDLPDDVDRLQPRELRQVHVHQGEMDVLILDDVDRLLAALGQEGVETCRLEDLAERLACDGIVVGDQNGGAIQGHDDRSRSRQGTRSGSGRNELYVQSAGQTTYKPLVS